LKATVSEPESWKRVIDVELSEEEVASSFKVKVADYKRKARLPGFRPGKVPDAIIISRFGKGIRAEVIEELIKSSYEDTCKEHAINPVSEGRLHTVNAEEGKPVTFSIETEVEPDIEIKNYQKLKIKKNVRKIKSSDIDSFLEELRTGYAEFKDVDRPSAKNDFVSMKYNRVVVDGEEKSDITSPTHPVEIGSSSIKQFDKGLINRTVGEPFDITVVFPDDYGDKELSGREATLTIELTAIQERILPEIDEAFAKKIGDFESVEALRERIDENLRQREEDNARNEAYNNAIETLIQKNPFDVPPSLLNNYVKSLYDETKNSGRNNGQSQEEFQVKYRDIALRNIKRFRIIDFIARAENIKATQEEVDERIRRLAESYQRPFEEVKQALRRNQTVQRIRSDIREKKTLDFLIGESGD